ncbi:MAG TPA: PqqD family protein [Bryobacteraceae bacterium]|nr:PqqD family protein [Bryobacteraceae bacterium]
MTSHRVYPNDRIRSNNQFPSAEIHDEIVLMNMERGRYFSLNDTGGAVFCPSVCIDIFCIRNRCPAR